MTWFFFDASALAKRYSPETGTPLINAAFRYCPDNRMTCSTIGVLEIVSILARKHNDGRLNPALFRQAMVEFRAEVIDGKDFAVTAVTDALLLSALSLIPKHNLNATDAVILRSVLDLKRSVHSAGEDVILLTADKHLARAAQNEGLTVVDPETASIKQLRQLIAAGASSSSIAS